MLANTALEVEYRHLSYFSGPFIMIALADPKVSAEVKEAMARKLLGLLDTWEPSAMPIRDRVFPDLGDENLWKVLHLILHYMHLLLHMYLLLDLQFNFYLRLRLRLRLRLHLHLHPYILGFPQVLQEYVRSQLLIKPSYQNFTESEVLENLVILQGKKYVEQGDSVGLQGLAALAVRLREEGVIQLSQAGEDMEIVNRVKDAGVSWLLHRSFSFQSYTQASLFYLSWLLPCFCHCLFLIPPPTVPVLACAP